MTGSNENQVFDLYQDVLSQLSASKKSPKAEEKAGELVMLERQIIEEAAKESPIELAQHLSNIKVSLVQAVEEIEDKILSEKDRFTNLQRAIVVAENQLTELYGIKREAETLEALITANRNNSYSFEQSILHRKKEWQQEEKTYTAQRDALREKEYNELESSILAAERDLAQELKTKREAYSRYVQEEEEKLKSREEKILARENEFAQFRAKVESFPDVLRDVVQKTEETLTAQLSAKYNHQIELLQNEIRLANQTLATYEAKVAHFEALKKSLKEIQF